MPVSNEPRPVRARGGGERRPAGIRRRVTMTATAIVAAALLVSGAGVTFFLRQSLIAGLDAAAAARSRDVAALASAGTLPATISTTGEDSELVQVVDAHNNVVAASSNIQGQEAVLPSPSSVTGGPRTTSLAPVGNGEFRVAVQPLPNGKGWVVVASDLTQLNAAVLNLVVLFAIALPVTLLIVGGTLWHAVGRVLRPVEAIRERAARIGGADPSQRVPVPATSDEIARLAVTMNEMLDRLQSAARRQHEFIGDASHELRSPLAALRAQVDVALAHPDDPTSRGLLDRVSEQAARMSTLIDDLLFLARSSEPAPVSNAELVDLDELVIAEVHRLRELGGPAVDLVGLSAARLSGSGRDLARMLRNLGDNAREHAVARVEVRLSGNGAAEISIADDGPGIPAGDRLRVFERFTRLDDSRVRNPSGGGAGIGLSIVRQIVHAHGGTVEVRDRWDGGSGAVFVVRLPMADGGAAQ